MSLLAVKLIVTPLMTLAASLVGRRWGAAFDGWLVGLPLTSGPVAVFLAVERGPAFATEASAGSLAGVTAQACFCLGYAAVGGKGWSAGLLVGAGAFAASAMALQVHGLAPALLFALALVALAIALRLLPRDSWPSGHGECALRLRVFLSRAGARAAARRSRGRLFGGDKRRFDRPGDDAAPGARPERGAGTRRQAFCRRWSL